MPYVHLDIDAADLLLTSDWPAGSSAAPRPRRAAPSAPARPPAAPHPGACVVTSAAFPHRIVTDAPWRIPGKISRVPLRIIAAGYLVSIPFGFTDTGIREASAGVRSEYQRMKNSKPCPWIKHAWASGMERAS